jgi:hypothetical protein
MGTLAEDFRAAVGGVVQVAEGLRALDQATTSVFAQVDGVVEHMTAPATAARVASAGLDAVLTAAASEVRAGAARPRQPPASPAPPAPPPKATAPNVLRCRLHGEHRWAGTIVCAACGHVYQVLDPHKPRHAPETCPCGVRLMPPGKPDGAPPSAVPICSVCFVGIAAGTGIAVKVPRSPP